MSLEEKLKQGTVLIAEGYVFELARRCLLSRGAFVPEVVLDFPETVIELHREFARAGSDVILALTYYAHEEKMRAIGQVRDLRRINVQAVQIAKQVAKEFPGTLVAGNICNTGVFNPNDLKASGDEIRRMYTDQIAWAANEGVDYIVAETLGYLDEALIAHEVISSFGLPSVVTFASHLIKIKGKNRNVTLDGVPFGDACKSLEDAGALVVGLNCSRGPNTMLPLVKNIRNKVNGYVAAIPVPYRTTKQYPSFWELNRKSNPNEKAFPENLDPHLHDIAELVDFAQQATNLGVNYLGLCCGASPEQIRAITCSLGRTPPGERYATNMDQHYIFGTRVEPFNKR